MTKNRSLARALVGGGLFEVARQLRHKVPLQGGILSWIKGEETGSTDSRGGDRKFRYRHFPAQLIAERWLVG